jgi:hypothetical protein
MRPDRDPLRWLPLRAGLVAAFLAGIVAVATAMVALRMEIPLEEERAAGQRAVLDLLADELGRAIALGIPLDALPDLQPHLEATLGQFPALSGITIEMPDGFRAVEGAPDPDDIPRRAAIGDGVLTLYRVPDGSLKQALWVAAAVAALGSGLGAALLSRLVVTRPARRVEAVLEGRFAAIVGGDFAPPPGGVGGLPNETLATELEEWRARVARKRRQLDRQAEGVRAIDFDGTIGVQVDAILARVDETRRFPEPTG